MNESTFTKNVESFLKTRLKNINVVNEINQLLDNQYLNMFHIEEITNLNIDKLYKEFYEIKKKLQLALNLYNSRELYKDCVVQRDPVGDIDYNNNQALIIEMAYKYIQYLITISNMEIRIVNSAEIAKNIGLPTNTAPTECPMCSTKIEPNEIRCSVCLEMTQNHKRKQFNNNETFNYKRTKTEDEQNKKTNDNTKLCATINDDVRKCSNRGYGVDIIPQDDTGNERGMISRNVNQSLIANKVFYEILIYHKDSWLCRDCELLNSYKSDTCDICYEDKKVIGLWICTGCSLVNKISEYRCEACNRENNSIQKHVAANKKNANKQTNKKQKNVKTITKNKDNCADEAKTKSNKSRDIICTENCDPSNSKWICWYTDCKHNNDATFEFCYACKLQKSAPDRPTDCVKINTKEQISLVWICMKCGKRNKKMESKCLGGKCGALRMSTPTKPKPKKEVEELNKSADQPKKPLQNGDRIIQREDGEMGEKPSETDHQMWSCFQCTFNNVASKNVCEICRYDKKQSKWQCRHKNCKQMNDEEFNFCQFCNLYKHFSMERGALVKLKVKDKAAKDIWICTKCSKFNGLEHLKCSGKNCKETRFAKP